MTTSTEWREILSDPDRELSLELHELLTLEHCHVWREELVNLPPGPGGLVPRGMGTRGVCVRCLVTFDTTEARPRPAEGNAWPDYTGSWEGVGLVVDRMRERGWFVDIEMRPDGAQAVFYTPTAPDCRRVIRIGGASGGPSPGVAVARAALGALRNDRARARPGE